MSNEIRHKRSSVSGSKPALSLPLGELAINTADGVLFTKKNAGSDVMVEFHGSETPHLFKHQTSVPNPSSGYVCFYPKSDNNFYLRTSAGVERRLWDSGNHGPGSGLNADLLDGLHSANFYTDGLNFNFGLKQLRGSTPDYPSLTRFSNANFLADVAFLTGKEDMLYNIDRIATVNGDISISSTNVTGSLSGLFDGNHANSDVIVELATIDEQNPSTWGIIEITHNNPTTTLFNSAYWEGSVFGIIGREGWGYIGQAGSNNSITSFLFEARSTHDGNWYTMIDYSGTPLSIMRGITFHPMSAAAYSAGVRNYSGIRLSIRGGVAYSLPNSNHIKIGGLVFYNNFPNSRINRSVNSISSRGDTAYGDYTFYGSTNNSAAHVVRLMSSSGTSLLSVRNDGLITITNRLSMSIPTGTAPFVIASTTLNTNLNADLLDGYHASSFALSSHTHAYLPLSGGTMSNTNLVTNLNADLLDGLHYSAFAPASHYHSFAGLTDVALVSPSAGHTLVYNGSAWVNNSQIRSVPGAEYNTIYIRSADISNDFGDSEMYMTAEEGIYFRTNIGKATAAEASFDQYGIRSSKLMGTGERYLAAGSDGLIKVATVQPTQYWQRDVGNYILSPIESYDEVHAWLFKAGGVLVSDGYLETGRSGMYTVYNDMVVSEFYLSNNTFYYANSKLAFNNSTNLLTVSGGIDAGSNLIAAGEVKLTKQTPGGVLRLQSHNAGPEFLRQYDYAGGVIFEAYNGSGYSGVATISARASQNHSGSGLGTNLEFWNYPDGGSNTRPAMILREDGVLDNYFGFAVGGSDGRSGTATILTGCSYNSVTKTLIYTRASVTFSGGIVTSIASMSSLSVPLS